MNSFVVQGDCASIAVFKPGKMDELAPDGCQGSCNAMISQHDCRVQLAILLIKIKIKNLIVFKSFGQMIFFFCKIINRAALGLLQRTQVSVSPTSAVAYSFSTKKNWHQGIGGHFLMSHSLASVTTEFWYYRR